MCANKMLDISNKNHKIDLKIISKLNPITTLN